MNSVVYFDGKSTAKPRSLQETYEIHRQQGGIAWIDLYKPTETELASLAQEFRLHPLAVEDALEAHQRAKIEHYDHSIFIGLKAAHYLEEPERNAFNEIHIFAGENFTVRHGEVPAIGEAQRRLEDDSELPTRSPEVILHAIMDRVVDDYEPVIESIRTDIEEIEAEVYSGKIGVSRRIHEPTGQVFHFQRDKPPSCGACTPSRGPGAKNRY